MLKIKKTYYCLTWWETGRENFQTYKQFDTAEEADGFLQEELKEETNIIVSKHYVLERSVNDGKKRQI